MTLTKIDLNRSDSFLGSFRFSGIEAMALYGLDGSSAVPR